MRRHALSIFDWKQDLLFAVFDEKAGRIRSRFLRVPQATQHGGELLLRQQSNLSRNLLPNTLERCCQPLGIHRLCQVIHGMDIECPDRVLVVRSHRNGRREML